MNVVRVALKCQFANLSGCQMSAKAMSYIKTSNVVLAYSQSWNFNEEELEVKFLESSRTY